MAAIEVKNVSKEFPAGDTKITVLQDINVSIKRGELTLLVGPSGCGKTTLISIMSGILTPTSGDVVVMGETITRLKDKQNVLFRRHNIGFIFQQYNLMPALTAAENAAMPLIAAGKNYYVALSKAREILDQLSMGAHADKTPNQLSGGQQQRVAIARSLVHDPKLIVCDEPTAALDAQTGRDVMTILKRVASEKDRAVLVVTHDNRIYSFADRIIEMSDGKIINQKEMTENA